MNLVASSFMGIMTNLNILVFEKSKLSVLPSYH
jgi:hypothetical protein